MPRQFLILALALTFSLINAAAVLAQTPSPVSVSSSAYSPQVEQFKRTIRKLYDLKEAAWAAGDAESIVTKFYSPDAISVGEGDPQTMIGREAFRKAYQQYVKDVPKIRIESVSSYVNGSAGWDWANFYSEPEPDKKAMYPPSPIRILFLFTKEKGRWICKGDIFANGKFPTIP
jgi:uncharacterized protein (TIGR02246 family)